MYPLYLQIERDVAQTCNRYRRQSNMYFWYEYTDAYYGPNHYDEVSDDRTLDLGFHNKVADIKEQFQERLIPIGDIPNMISEVLSIAGFAPRDVSINRTIDGSTVLLISMSPDVSIHHFAAGNTITLRDSSE